MDLGAGRRGVDMGPSAMRHAGLADAVRSVHRPFEDGGDIMVPIPERREPGSGPRYLKEIHHVCDRLARRTEAALEDGALPLVVGGDHSMAVGTVAGVSRFHRKRGERIGLIWIDAHADMNTPETSPSGNVHGMPLSSILGHGAPELVELGGAVPMIAPENTVLIGIRDVDEGERQLVIQTGIDYYEMMKIDVLGIGEVIRRTLEVVTDGTAGFHVSLDVDGIDPDFAPGVGTPVVGGLTMRETHVILEFIADSGGMTSLEVAELNPILDNGNGTATLMCELVASALGKKVMGRFEGAGH